MKVPVHPLVAVEKPEHLAAQAKRNALRRPSEANAVSALAARGVADRLFEGMKWHRHLEDDPALFELAACREMRGRPVPQGLDHDRIVAGARKPGQSPAYVGAGHAVEVASDDHEASIPAIG